MATTFLRRLVPFTVVAVLLAGGAQSAHAQDDETTYVSPTYGYELTWDETWTLEDETSEGGYDFLYLTDEASEFYLEAYPDFGGDPVECLEANRDYIADAVEGGEVEVVETADGELLEGEDEGVAYAVYSGVLEESEVEVAFYLECRTLDSASVLVITYLTLLENLQEGIGRLEELLNGLTMPTAPTAEDLPALQESTEQDLTNFWTGAFEDLGEEYVVPEYVSFDDAVETECGEAEAGDIGPFYCPADQTIYLDQLVMEQAILPYGDFVVAVVLAHETGHHVQEILNLSGCDDDGCGRRGSSLAIELQADCLAGAWAKDAEARGEIQPGEVEQTIVAISDFFGDPPGTAPNDPEAHGPGALRTWWFLKGYYDGLPECLGDGEE